jgi:endoglucanase
LENVGNRFSGKERKDSHDISKLWQTNGSAGITYRNYPYNLKGINWFGMETKCRVLNGLWTRDLDSFFNTLADYQYNAIRIPLPLEAMYEKYNRVVDESCLDANNQWLLQLSTEEILHVLFQKSAQRGIAVLLDCHSVQGLIVPFPDSIDTYLSFWLWIVSVYSMYDNFMGIDIKNEPHGADYSWDEWCLFTSTIIHTVRTECPFYQGLFFIEGVESHGSVWGGSFYDLMQDRLYNPILSPTLSVLWNSDDVVFSPHLYGVSIRGERALEDDSNTYQEWFGDLASKWNKTVVLGEFGGWFIASDALWQKRVLVYLQTHNLRDMFYWALNPNSQDTGGLIYNDWFTINAQKAAFHDKLQPFPTMVSFEREKNRE